MVISQNNFFEQDLSFLSHLEKIKNLEAGNNSERLITQNIYNRFTGSLKCLENMNDLKSLEIESVDIDSGLEYLPVNITEFYCSSYERKNSKVEAIEKELKKHGEPELVSNNLYNFASLLKEWQKTNFNLIITASQKQLKEVKAERIKLEEQLQIEREEFKKFQDKSVNYQQQREDKIAGLEKSQETNKKKISELKEELNNEKEKQVDLEIELREKEEKIKNLEQENICLRQQLVNLQSNQKQQSQIQIPPKEM